MIHAAFLSCSNLLKNLLTSFYETMFAKYFLTSLLCLIVEVLFLCRQLPFPFKSLGFHTHSRIMKESGIIPVFQRFCSVNIYHLRETVIFFSAIAGYHVGASTIAGVGNKRQRHGGRDPICLNSFYSGHQLPKKSSGWFFCLEQQRETKILLSLTTLTK